MKSKLILFLTFCSFIFSTYAQELDATVIINYEQLSFGGKERLVNFKDQIEAYLNNTKFTGQAWEGERIKCSFNIFFAGWSNETNYTAQMVVTSQRPIEGTSLNSLMLQVMDNKWSFVYERNQAMYFNQTDFDPLLSFLNYYAYLIIGFDLDSYYKLGGSDYFSKALEIAVRGGSSKFSDGWQSESSTYNKRVLVDNLVNAKYQQFRMDIFDYHYNGLDLLNDPQNSKMAMNNIVKLVKNLFKAKDQIDSRSVFLKVFFDAKAGEIVDRLKNHPEKIDLANMLRKVDPAHTAKYDELLK